jgi:hypothetical protein
MWFSRPRLRSVAASGVARQVRRRRGGHGLARIDPIGIPFLTAWTSKQGFEGLEENGQAGGGSVATGCMLSSHASSPARGPPAAADQTKAPFEHRIFTMTPCLLCLKVPSFFHSLSITSIFNRLPGVLNVGKKNN